MMQPGKARFQKNRRRGRAGFCSFFIEQNDGPDKGQGADASRKNPEK
jgi:hypothetical protein